MYRTGNSNRAVRLKISPEGMSYINDGCKPIASNKPNRQP